MKMRLTWREIRESLLADRRAAPQPRPAAAFWEDFRARAALHPQRAPERGKAPFFIPYGWAAVGGTFALVAVAAGVYLTGVSAAGPSAVRSYTVGVKHSAVVLLTDRSAKATILWVSGMELGGKGEL